MSRPRGEVVQIASFGTKDVKVKFNDVKLTEVIDSRPEVWGLPTIVISIGGVARSGKSFLMNMFVSYLSYLEENGNDRGWETSDWRVEGINWAQSKVSVTMGMWIWSRPFIITRSDGTKAAVLLVDSQGTGDHSLSATTLDTLIMYISLQISSVQILNVTKYLTSNSMISLQLCAEYADNVGADPASPEDDFLFQSLMFLIRDYQAGDHYGEDPESFSKIVNGVVSDELRPVVLGIRSAFRTINSYNMPGPGDAIAHASVNTGSWRVKDVPENFVATTKSLIKKICGLEEGGTVNECWSSARELSAHFQMLKDLMENSDLLRIANPSEALHEAIIYRAHTGAQKKFAEIMLQFDSSLRLAGFGSEEKLREGYNIEIKCCQDVFEKSGKCKNKDKCAIWRKYQSMLETTFEQRYAIISMKHGFELRILNLETEKTALKRQRDADNQKFQQQLSSLRAKITADAEAWELKEVAFKEKRTSMEAEIITLQQQQCSATEENTRLANSIKQQRTEFDNLQEQSEVVFQEKQTRVQTQIVNLQQQHRAATEENTRLANLVNQERIKFNNLDGQHKADARKNRANTKSLVSEEGYINRNLNKPSHAERRLQREINSTRTKQEGRVRIMEQETTRNPVASFFAHAVGGAVMGAAAGTAAGIPGGPIGMGVGAAVGSLTGLVSGVIAFAKS